METEEEILQRFLDKVDKTDHQRCKDHGCWMWTAGVNNQHGAFFLDFATEGAHRIAYEFLVGESPEGMIVVQTCPGDHNLCVNPDHLRLVSRSQLTKERNARLRNTHCPQGHEFTPENTYYRSHKNRCKKGRRCRQCHLAYNKKYQQNKKNR